MATRPLRCKGRRSERWCYVRKRMVTSPARGCGSQLLAVYQRLHHRSAFNGYRMTPSRYSGVRCLGCGREWRTKASVAHLPDLQREIPNEA